jgi:hypothetical protein
MSKPKKDDYVVILSTQEVGIVTEIVYDPFQYKVMARGEILYVNPRDLVLLDIEKTWALNHALVLTASAIDQYRDEELYDPVYDKSGHIIYSSAAAAVLRSLAYPSLILELHRAAEKITLLENRLREMEHGNES